MDDGMCDDEKGARGCGQRKCGGIYATTKLGVGGMPFDYFIICPPVPVDKTEMGISPLGIKLVDNGGITTVLDWVGSNNYPNVADFVEETRRMGLSRRVSPKTDFARIDANTRWVLIHERAIVNNATELFEACDYAWPRGCPRDVPTHTDEARRNRADITFGLEFCAGAWYETVTGDATAEMKGSRDVLRIMPSFQYSARRTAQGFVPDYHLGMFLWLPISGIEIINDAEGGTHEEAYEAAKAANVPVEIVDE